MEFVPRKYQQMIIEHILTHPRCMVWAGMGTGKTVSTLTAIGLLQEFYTNKPALIVAPLRVARSTWPDECLKWDHLSGLTVSVITGTPAQRQRALDKKADIYCTNYESLPWLVSKFIDKPWPFGIIVADESTRLKGFRAGAKKPREGLSRSRWLGLVAHHSEHFIELTGTPTANGLIDLWGQAWFIDKGAVLGRTMSAYQQAYFTPVRTGGEAYMVKWVPRFGSDQKIKESLSIYTVTINAEDWFDIKDPIINDIVVDMPAKAAEMYDKMENEFFVELLDGKSVESVNAMSSMSKCLQIASGAIYTEDKEWQEIHTAKIEALESIVEEANGAPVLVAYQFVHEAERILAKFKKAKMLDSNPETIRAWNRGELPMLVAHPASCGHGLNLQDGGNILVFFSSGFNYEQYAQMCERIGPTRQAQAGHPRPVFIHRLVARGTLDNAVIKALGKKQNVLDFILDRRKKNG